MSRLSKEVRLHRRGGIPRKVRRSIRRRSHAIAGVIALGRFFMMLGVLGLVAWSYALWGSEATPLRHLFWPAIALIFVSVIIRMALLRWVAWIRRALRLQKKKQEVRDYVRSRSQIVRKPDL